MAGYAIALALAANAVSTASAQIFRLPKMPGSNNKNNSKNKKDSDSGATAAGVPVPMDSPIIVSFQNLEQQPVYHWRMVMPEMDPNMAAMMAQMGMTPTETTVAGDTKFVHMHYRAQATDVPGQVDDWDIFAVSRGERAASRFTSSAVPRLLAAQEAQFAKYMAEINKMAAQSIAKSLASGPTGWVSAGVTAASTAANEVMVTEQFKKAREFFDWKCRDVQRPEVNKNAPPPLTDLKTIGDDKIDGADVTVYEFFVRENGKFQGPMRMSIWKDSGLPARIELADKRMPSTMRMEYYDYGKSGDFEVPACLEKK